MKDPGCSRRTRASGRRAGAPSIAVAMVGVKRKLRRARTRERQDSRAMPYKVCLSCADTDPLQHLGLTRIAWRDRQGWRKCRPCTTARMQEVGRSTPAGMQAIERRRRPKSTSPWMDEVERRRRPKSTSPWMDEVERRRRPKSTSPWMDEVERRRRPKSTSPWMDEVERRRRPKSRSVCLPFMQYAGN